MIGVQVDSVGVVRYAHHGHSFDERKQLPFSGVYHLSGLPANPPTQNCLLGTRCPGIAWVTMCVSHTPVSKQADWRHECRPYHASRASCNNRTRSPMSELYWQAWTDVL